MDDGNYSSDYLNNKYNKKDTKVPSISGAKKIEYYRDIRRNHKMYDDLNVIDKTYRFGFFDPDNAITTTREYLFFTKPDLNILKRDDISGAVNSGALADGIDSIPFFQSLFQSRKKIIKTLQSSYGTNDPFNHLLQNMVISNLDIPSLSAETIDNATNAYGVGYSYRGSSESSDDNPTFSLEFRDNRSLDVYYFFKAYEEYETLKHHGIVRPWLKYIEDKILHDQFSIYKFLVDEDMETILYYGKYYGVMPISLPRDTFSSSNFDSGLSYSIDFKAAFYDDMKPEILYDFNEIAGDFYDKQKYVVTPYNTVLDQADMRPATAAFITAEQNSNRTSGYDFKLKWKGRDMC